ncbi:hypothetical protein RRG08_033907 [Elysia crispata]|uniref:Uncharacterized protein n=1 Tax=Elysia crispata TaxID=231223 RepID=A0AAE1B8Z6_9GAST|nr:hypothetical protein RRG08_033907 [Elysia crispata]
MSGKKKQIFQVLRPVDYAGDTQQLGWYVDNDPEDGEIWWSYREVIRVGCRELPHNQRSREIEVSVKVTLELTEKANDLSNTRHHLNLFGFSRISPVSEFLMRMSMRKILHLPQFSLPALKDQHILSDPVMPFERLLSETDRRVNVCFSSSDQTERWRYESKPGLSMELGRGEEALRESLRPGRLVDLPSDVSRHTYSVTAYLRPSFTRGDKFRVGLTEDIDRSAGHLKCDHHGQRSNIQRQQNAVGVGSLTSTLSTHYSSACGGEIAHLSCPPPTLITVQYAKYGRSVPSSQMCGNKTKSRSRNLSRSLRNPLLSSTAAPKFEEDTRCVAVRSLEVSGVVEELRLPG